MFTLVSALKLVGCLETSSSKKEFQVGVLSFMILRVYLFNPVAWFPSHRYLPNRYGVLIRYRFRYYGLRQYLGWTLQSLCFYCPGHLQGIPSSEGTEVRLIYSALMINFGSYNN